MLGKDVSVIRPVWSEKTDAQNPRRFEQPKHIRALLAAAGHAQNLAISVMDSQTRIESVNAALARETRITISQHIGKTSREVVGDLAGQIEPTYEKVLRTGKPASVCLAGHVRDTPEFEYWMDYCFPILDQSGRVEQLGLFGVNVTAEKASIELFDALALDSRFLSIYTSRLAEGLDEAVEGYYRRLKMSFENLSCPFTETARKADHFRRSLERLDGEICLMRELVTTMIAQLPIPKC